MSEVTQPPRVETPKSSSSVVNIGNIFLLGGLGFVLYRTFLMEERLNDLTTIVKRNQRTPPPHGAKKTQQQRQQPVAQYETSSSSSEEEDKEVERHDDSSDDDDVRIEEQPEERLPNGDESVVEESPATSAFVTTRLRRASELRRGGSHPGDR